MVWKNKLDKLNLCHGIERDTEQADWIWKDCAWNETSPDTNDSNHGQFQDVPSCNLKPRGLRQVLEASVTQVHSLPEILAVLMMAGTLDPLDFGSPVQDMRPGTDSGSEGSV